MTKEKVKQLVAAVAVAGTIGTGFAINYVTDLQKTIVSLEELESKLSQENTNLIVERDNLQALTKVQEAEIANLKKSPKVSEEAEKSTLETVYTEPENTNVSENKSETNISYNGGDYLGHFEATAYEIGGLTSLGCPAEPGVVAVDPNVIPLGSTIYVEFDGYPELNGNYYCADTGGAINGMIIDVCMESGHDEFGRRGCHVYLLS